MASGVWVSPLGCDGMVFPTVRQYWTNTAGLLRRRSLRWALAAAVAVLGAAPAAATESFRDRVTAPPGVLVSVSAHWWYGERHYEEGTNPRVTDATFSTTAYYDVHEIRDDKLWVKAKTAADLNALPVPPPTPFEVEVEVSLNNDDNRVITGTIVFETPYLRTAATPSPPDGEETSGGDG